MKQYYYIDENKNKVGPLSLEELREKKITRKTFAWVHPMSEWRPAGEFAEFADMFEFEPPEMNAGAAKQQPPRQDNFPKIPRTWLVESILVTLFCCLPFGIAGIVFASRVESKHQAGDYVGAEKASREAGQWTKIGFWLAIIFYFGWIILALAGVTAGIFAGL
jgi:hypothetical protein